MNLGIFGGSFDPVHRGHLQLAETARRQAKLDRVLFVPAARQPLKPGGPHASDADRLEMLRLAVNRRNGLAVSSIELDRGGVSYTADTLRQLTVIYVGARLYFLLGADALLDLPNWREPEAILSLATLLVVEREGHPLPDLTALSGLAPPQRLREIAAQRLQMPLDPASSSEIRRRIARGVPWQELTTPEVAQFIAAKGLYRLG